MPQARIEITPEVLKSFVETLPPDVKIVGTGDSMIDRHVLVLWIEGPNLPNHAWVTAKVTARTVYDMTFEPAPAKPYAV